MGVFAMISSRLSPFSPTGNVHKRYAQALLGSQDSGLCKRVANAFNLGARAKLLNALIRVQKDPSGANIEGLYKAFNARVLKKDVYVEGIPSRLPACERGAVLKALGVSGDILVAMGLLYAKTIPGMDEFDQYSFGQMPGILARYAKELRQFHVSSLKNPLGSYRQSQEIAKTLRAATAARFVPQIEKERTALLALLDSNSESASILRSSAVVERLNAKRDAVYATEKKWVKATTDLTVSAPKFRADTTRLKAEIEKKTEKVITLMQKGGGQSVSTLLMHLTNLIKKAETQPKVSTEELTCVKKSLEKLLKRIESARLTIFDAEEFVAVTSQVIDSLIELLEGRKIFESVDADQFFFRLFSSERSAVEKGIKQLKDQKKVIESGLAQRAEIVSKLETMAAERKEAQQQVEQIEKAIQRAKKLFMLPPKQQPVIEEAALTKEAIEKLRGIRSLERYLGKDISPLSVTEIANRTFSFRLYTATFLALAAITGLTAYNNSALFKEYVQRGLESEYMPPLVAQAMRRVSSPVAHWLSQAQGHLTELLKHEQAVAIRDWLATTRVVAYLMEFFPKDPRTSSS